jgi:hypothetical protein
MFSTRQTKAQEQCALIEEKLGDTGAQLEASSTKSLCLLTLQSGASHASAQWTTKLLTL